MLLVVADVVLRFIILWGVLIHRVGCSPCFLSKNLLIPVSAKQSLIFICLGHHLGGILGSWGTTLAQFRWSLGARVQSGVPLNVPMMISFDFWWISGCLLAPVWGHFFISCVIWGIKNHGWIAGTILRDFWLESWLNYDVPIFQKHIEHSENRRPAFQQIIYKMARHGPGINHFGRN